MQARLEDRFVSFYETHVGRTLNGTNAKLQELRSSAIARFNSLGFPTTKDEAWRYTNIAEALRREYKVQVSPRTAGLDRDALAPLMIPDLDAHSIVLVNGAFSEELSAIGALPDGVVITGMQQAARSHAAVLNRHLGRYADFSEDAFTALNTAFTLSGLFVYVPKGKVLEKPVHVINVLSVQEDVFLQPRNLLIFEENSQARVIHSSHGPAQSNTFTNVVNEVYVGSRAVVGMYLVQDEGELSSQVSNTHVYQEEASVFSLHTVTLTGEVVRNNVTVLPDAEFCETHLYGLFLTSGRMHVDNHTLVDHAKPNCVSNELYKGVLDDRSSGVFNGKVLVRPDAQKTNAFQENKSILLTPTATMNSKPELEIYADDVKCSHGATTGQLDKDALFYLRSRGIPATQARGMLLHAFAGDVLETIPVKPLRTLLDRRVTERFGW